MLRSSAIAIAALLSAGCTSVEATDATFAGTEWRVTAIDGRATPASDAYRMQFGETQVGGRFGCNQFGGRYDVTAETLVVADVVSTLMGCPEPAATFENEGLAVLQQPMAIEWQSDDNVTLSNAVGSIVLERS